MRIDLYLKVTRLVLRRSLAQNLCDHGLVMVNGVTAKASKEVKVGDEIEITRRDRLTKVRVARVPQSKQVSRSEAGKLYDLLEETRVDDEF